jgi:DNA mismatch endonuclease (patch repair protein)
MPKTRIPFWADKFEKNVARDRRNARAIRKLGWKVVTVWECQCKYPEKLSKRLKRFLSV